MIETLKKNSYRYTQDDRDRLLGDCARKIAEIIQEVNRLSEAYWKTAQCINPDLHKRAKELCNGSCQLYTGDEERLEE